MELELRVMSHPSNVCQRPRQGLAVTQFWRRNRLEIDTIAQLMRRESSSSAVIIDFSNQCSDGGIEAKM